MNSLLSIVVPCYNQAQYLPQTLESVLRQTYTTWECIIVDDGSTDSTPEIAKEWMSRDNRYKYLHQENKGVSSARNFGISNSNGDFLLPLDADDLISPQYSARAMEAFQNNPDLKIVYCIAEKFGEEKGVWELPPFSLKNLSRKNMIFSSAVYRKSDWKAVGGYDCNMSNGLEDWDFWISILKNGGEVEQLKETGFFYRIKTRSRSTQIDSDTYEELCKYMSIKHAEFFVQQFGSFQFLAQKNAIAGVEQNKKLKSEKYVIDLFCKTFMGFSIFGKYK